jgi:hypothetical protein
MCIFPILHELRGGCLDHERREMSEKRETVNADMDQTIPRLARVIAPFDYAQGRLRQGRRYRFFFTKCWLEEPTFPWITSASAVFSVAMITNRYYTARFRAGFSTTIK